MTGPPVLRSPAALAVLAAFAEAVWTVTLDTYGGNPHTCIEATRIAIIAGRAFAYPIEAVPVTCGSATADWWDFTGPAAQRPGWSVGVAATGASDAAANRWDGHLVGHVKVGDAGFLLDCTAAQRHRPRRGLAVPGPLVVPVGRAGLRDGFAARDREHRVMHWYCQTDDHAWRRAGGWTGHRHVVVRAAGRVIRAHADLLAEAAADAIANRP